MFRDTLERQKQKYGIDYEDEEDQTMHKYRLMRRAKSGGDDVIFITVAKAALFGSAGPFFPGFNNLLIM